MTIFIERYYQQIYIYAESKFHPNIIRAVGEFDFIVSTLSVRAKIITGQVKERIDIILTESISEDQYIELKSRIIKAIKDTDVAVLISTIDEVIEEDYEYDEYTGLGETELADDGVTQKDFSDYEPLNSKHLHFYMRFYAPPLTLKWIRISWDLREYINFKFFMHEGGFYFDLWLPFGKFHFCIQRKNPARREIEFYLFPQKKSTDEIVESLGYETVAEVQSYDLKG